MKQNINRFALLSLDDDEGHDAPATPPSPPQDPRTPPASGCPLMRIPAELRLNIFGMVLQAQAPVVNVGHLPAHRKSRRFDTALLRVSRQIAIEADEAFYTNNTIRVKSLNDPYTTRKHIRHLELAGDVAHRMFAWGAPITNVTSHGVSQFCKIKSITVAIDSMFDGKHVARAAPLPPQLGRAEDAAQPAGRAVRVVEYGVFELPRYPEQTHDYYLKRFRVVDAVRYAKALDQSLSLAQLHGRVLTATPGTREHALRKFTVWVAGLELIRKEIRGMVVEEEDQAIMSQFLIMGPGTRHTVEQRLMQIPAGARLLDLTAEEHGEEVLWKANSLVHAVDLEWRA